MVAALGAVQSVASSLLPGAKTKSWRDRLKQAVYTSPLTKTRIQFDYEDVSRSFEIHGTDFDFPGVDDCYVQLNGFSSRKYPLTCFFTGKDCDLLATSFEAALLEPGIGKLEHPIYGTVNVVPFGTVERNDALKTAANQSVVTVTFWTTVAAIYPASQANALDEIRAAIADFNVQAAQQFASNTSLSQVGTALSAIGTIKGFLNKVKTSLSGVSDAVASVRKDFANALAAVNGGMDVLIGTPLLLAQQVSNLIQAPGRALTGLNSRLDAYDALAQSIFTSTEGVPAALINSGSVLLSHQTNVANNFHVASLFALSAVSGSVVTTTAQPIRASTQGLSSGAATFSTRSQVLAAASRVVGQFEQLVTWRDAGFGALGQITTAASFQIDTGEAYAALQKLVALTAGYLVQSSFSLLPEKAIVLTRPRTILDLSAELYGTIDDKLDLLIATNDLTGDELLELPAGRRIVYYPS